MSRLTHAETVERLRVNPPPPERDHPVAAAVVRGLRLEMEQRGATPRSLRQFSAALVEAEREGRLSAATLREGYAWLRETTRAYDQAHPLPAGLTAWPTE